MKQIPGFDDAKTTEAAAILLHNSNGKMEYFRLIKYLYLADKEALLRWERPITFDIYTSMEFGQVLSKTYDLVKKESKSASGLWEETIISDYGKSYNVELKEMPKTRKLSKAEIGLLEEIYKKYKGYTWEELGQETKGTEYKKPTHEQRSIPTKFNEVLKSLNYSEDDIERIGSNLEDYSYIQELSEI
jgi:hypothetical protein